MSATTSRNDWAALWSGAGVSHVGAVALGALRAAGSCAVPGAGCAAGAPRADARPVGCATAGGHSQRPGPLPVPGRGPSQGPRAAADPRRHPGLPDAGVGGDARAGAALAAPRAAGCDERARGHDCHLGARRHVGYRWRAGVHRGRRLGLDLRGRRPLERRVRGLACVQGGEPLCGSRAGRARAPATLRLGRGGRGPRAGAAEDHGSQYLSDHFLNQLRYWGIHPSFGFLEEPETNGVVERWNRTLKEQAVYGRVFRNLAEVRAAVAEFVERYNQCWRLEKLAYRTPLETREEYERRQAA